MLPGKQYKPEDFLWVAWSRKWFIVIPALLTLAGTYIWANTLPNRYRSMVTILVVPQKVPESYVRPTVTASLAERLQTIQSEILSRTRLERIIDEFNLYREERQEMIMEDVVNLMRTRDIRVEIRRPRRGADTTHFSVGFTSPQPRVAMQVADRLSQMFVNENLEDRAVLADATNQFLQAQLEDARRRLMDHEAKLRQFRERNTGQLPSQMQSNLQMMQVTQSRIQANNEAASRERDRLMAIEQQINDAVALADQQPTAPAATGEGGPPGSAAQQLEAARASLKNLERRLTPDHPDISHARRVIEQLEVKAASEAAGTGTKLDSRSARLPPAVASKVDSLRLQAEELRRSLEKRALDDERFRKALSTYNVRLEATPQLESELTDLMRDYGTIQDQYHTLLKRSEESKIALNLERRQIGEQFRVIDTARLPERPVSPNRTRYNVTGLLAGLGLGLLFVALLEYRDSTFKTDDDVVTSLSLPVLAVIPAMFTANERRRQKRKRLLVTMSAAAGVVLAAAAVIAWQMNVLQGWIR
jgi:polysaccharide chain length determinant protein (PEP-CTERM system associated)